MVKMGSKSNGLVYTSVLVTELLCPVLYVVHDEDGDWQFLSCHEEGDSDGRIVSLGTMLNMDPTLQVVLWLPMGMAAYRKEMDAEWELRVHKLEE